MARSMALRSSRTLPGQSCCHQQLGRRLGHAFDTALELAIVVLDEELRHRHDIVGAIAQGRNQNLNHVQPEIEVLAERAFLHRLAQILVGGRDYPQVQVNILEAAQAAEGLIFQHAQQLGLQHEGNLADFVQEQRAFIGQFEDAALLRRARP